jgi:Rieske Fe-S protein
MERRSFLKWATHGLGALFGTILGLPAVAYLIDARNRPAPEGDFKTVARLSELQVDVPKQVVLRDIRRDAWTLHPNDVIGRVWLLRRPGDQVEAFTTICPHLGCSINFEDKAKRFLCPCHGGTFHLSGERVSESELGTANPSPRGMDLLPVQMAEDPDPTHLVDDPDRPGQKKRDALIAVKYQNFIQGRHDKVPKA